MIDEKEKQKVKNMQLKKYYYCMNSSAIDKRFSNILSNYITTKAVDAEGCENAIYINNIPVIVYEDEKERLIDLLSGSQISFQPYYKYVKLFKSRIFSEVELLQELNSIDDEKLNIYKNQLKNLQMELNDLTKNISEEENENKMELKLKIKEIQSKY